MFRQIIGKIKSNPLRLAFSGAVVVLLGVLTIFAWDGITKRLLICVGLTVLSGLALLAPRLPNRISLPLFAVYRFYVTF